MGDVLETRPRATDGVDSVIVVDGVPAVGTDRLVKDSEILQISRICSRLRKQNRDDILPSRDKTYPTTTCLHIRFVVIHVQRVLGTDYIHQKKSR